MSNEVVKTKKAEIQNFSLSNSADTLNLANDLAKFIKENRLYQNIQGKEYVNVEGWQYAGGRLGIVPIVESVDDISTETEIKYKSKVNLLNLATGQTVGAGFAICSNKEQGKKYYHEYAIASMSQTRAIGKAYRNVLAWVITAAGYSPTPAEEMDSVNEPGTGVVEPVQSTQPEKQSTTPPQPESATQPAEAGSIKYASAKQKEEIIKLLNNPVITRAEKSKMLLNLGKIEEEQANKSIAKLKLVIKEREDEQSAAA